MKKLLILAVCVLLAACEKNPCQLSDNTDEQFDEVVALIRQVFDDDFERMELAFGTCGKDCVLDKACFTKCLTNIKYVERISNASGHACGVTINKKSQLTYIITEKGRFGLNAYINSGDAADAHRIFYLMLAQWALMRRTSYEKINLCTFMHVCSICKCF